MNQLRHIVTIAGMVLLFAGVVCSAVGKGVDTVDRIKHLDKGGAC